MNSFTKTLTNWYRGHKRDLPWRSTKDPYPIWLSEIILQQTRVEQGLPYWERFLEAFPNIADLANAPEENVLRLWQGLGYYSRARNLHATAKYVHQQLNDTFPSTYDEIIKLKGIGPYTAAAIASICFNEKRPVVDGNVFRFAARFFGIEIDITASNARKTFEQILDEYVPAEFPGDFNQALMEFGARECSPSPNCDGCVFNPECYAYREDAQKRLPIKTKKLKVRDRYFNYLIIKRDDHLYMGQRNGKDIWKGLYDFPLVEGKMEEEEVLNEAKSFLKEISFIVKEVSEVKTHLLSHQKILARFFEVEIQEKVNESVILKTEINDYSKEEILNLPKPKLIVNYLEERGII